MVLDDEQSNLNWLQRRNRTGFGRGWHVDIIIASSWLICRLWVGEYTKPIGKICFQIEHTTQG